ncbi:MAG: c-type cytochrome [Steroidobacter sp.]|nr:c-type cytochrome [Steroidobacter sp.]
MEKREALTTLASRAVFAKSLVAAMTAGKIAAGDLPADIASQIRALGDDELTAQLTQVWGVARVSSAEKLAAAARYKSVLAPSAPLPDAKQGREVFMRTCGACHKLFDEGGSIGPDITGSNRRDVDYLLHNILDPNSEIPNTYRMATVTLRDGRVLAGFANTQDPQVVVVTTPSEIVRVGRDEIASLVQSDVSMMPEGLLTPLTDSEVRDLFRYLRSGK